MLNVKRKRLTNVMDAWTVITTTIIMQTMTIPNPAITNVTHVATHVNVEMIVNAVMTATARSIMN